MKIVVLKKEEGTIGVLQKSRIKIPGEEWEIDFGYCVLPQYLNSNFWEYVSTQYEILGEL